MATDTALQELLLHAIQKLMPATELYSLTYYVSALVVIIALAMLSLVITRLVVSERITQFVFKTRSLWDDELHKHGFFRRCGHIIPAVVITVIAPLLLEPESRLLLIIERVSMLYLAIASLLILSALLNTIEDLYNASHLANRAPITGFIQVTKLLFTIVVILLVISLLIDKSPLLLLSGMTAIAAVLLLVFRDTILGFVAGIQIAAYRMFNTGDWITMHKFDVDGEILEIGLTNVKVQNWDKTISTLPTYTLTTEAVKNWRGMSESGGRRIKRAINIDLRSVRFCDEEMLKSFANIRFISAYIESKKQELKQYHQETKIDENDLLNSRKLTNLGTFRAYLEGYLKNNPRVNQQMTLMVRQLAPSEMGLPIEIYCFSANKDWVEYEKLQADIFDHVVSMLALFGLTAYQRDTITELQR